MSVGIAAVSEGNSIIGLSDRMITSEDSEYEPVFQKQFALSPNIGMLMAGDLTVHVDIITRMGEKVDQLSKTNPDHILTVGEMARLYAEIYTDEFAKRAARKYLAPFGLDMDSFLQRQNEFSPDFVNRLTDEMRGFSLPRMEAIIAGLDRTGVQIYHAFQGDITPQHVVGYSSIGSGYWHANSEFMSARHNSTNSIPETLFLAYRAKKRAEMASGVGKETDIFIISPEMPFTSISDSEIKKLDRIYNEFVGKERRITAQAIAKVETYAEQFYN
jgi:20S proteasome alpha/beta subunit